MNYSWELAEIKQDYYNDLGKKMDYIPFVKWFLKYFSEKIENEVLVLKSRSWTLSGGEIIESPFPPEQCISLGKIVEATPYICQKIGNTQITLQELNPIIRAQNDANVFITRIGDQIISLEKELSNLKNLFEKHIIQTENKSSDFPSSSTSVSDTPLIQPPINIKGFKMEKESDEFVKILEKKLSQLKINMVSQKDISEISFLCILFQCYLQNS